MKIWKLAVPILMVVLASCESVMTVKPGPFQPHKSYSVNMGKVWTAYPKDRTTRTQTLTIDGTQLNALYFASAVQDGKSLVYSRSRTKLYPKYRSDMTETEITEFVADMLTFQGMQNVQTKNLRPDTFGEASGLRFDFTGDTVSGLNMSGISKAATVNNELYLIVYFAPSEYYYDLHTDEIEAIFSSVSMK